MMNFKRSQSGRSSFTALPRHLQGSTKKIIETSVRIVGVQTKTPTAHQSSQVVVATATWYHRLLIFLNESQYLQAC
jgi:hypothetical protein